MCVFVHRPLESHFNWYFRTSVKTAFAHWFPHSTYLGTAVLFC